MNATQEQQELQDIIDIIITTAKLLGCRIHQFYTHTNIFQIDENKPIVSVSHKELSYTNRYTRTTRIIYEEYHSHQHKLEQLNKLLQNL